MRHRKMTLKAVNFKRRNGGFSLTELLVVVALVAGLIALLLPALAGARLASQGAVCGSHQKQILTAFHNYLVDQKSLPKLTRVLDARPPFQSNEDLFVPYYLMPVIWHVSANPAAPSEFVNFGRLWVLGLISDIRVFYCPTQTHDEFRFNTPVNPWPPQPEQRLPEAQFKFWNDVFSSYARRLGLSFIRFDSVPPQTAIVADVNMFPEYARTNHGAVGFNYARADGSVAWRSDPWYYDPSVQLGGEGLGFYDHVRRCLEAFERLDR